MTVVVITPAEPFVTFGDVDRHLAGIPAEDQPYVEGLVEAATAWIDGPAGWLGRALGPQLLEHRGWFGAECHRFNILPVIEVAEISYAGSDGARHVADPSTYQFDGIHLVVRSGAAWVTQPDHRIRYWAGYGKRDASAPESWVPIVPAPIRVAIMMLVAQWYNTREAAVVGDTPAEMPLAVASLLNPYRVYR